MARLKYIAASDGSVTVVTGDADTSTLDRVRFIGTVDTGDDANTAASVAALRAIAVAPLANSMWNTLGYGSAGDGGHGSYRWDSSSTDADDGALCIKVAAIPTGRFKFIMPVDRLFPLASCGIDGTGATPVGAALTALAANLYALGYKGFDGGGGTFNVTGTPYELPGRAEADGWLHRNFQTTGTAFDASINATLSVEIGITAAGAQGSAATLPYGPRSWTQTMFAGDGCNGDTKLVGVADIRNLAPGQGVLVRIGADPTDASGLPWIIYFAHIVSVTATTGNAGDVVLDVGLPETPEYPLRPGNLNTLRDGNKHDLLVITGYQDGVVFQNCTQKDVLISLQHGRSFKVENHHVKKSATAFILYNSHQATFDEVRVDSISGIDTDAGDPHSDPFANYGWFLVQNACYDTVLNNVVVDDLSASVGFIDNENQCRRTKLTGRTTVTLRPASYPDVPLASTLITHTPGSSDIIEIDSLVIPAGMPASGFSPNVRIKTLYVGDTNAYDVHTYLPTIHPQYLFAAVANVTDVLVFRGNEYRDRDTVCILMAGISASATKTFPIASNGIIRSARIYSSAVTGVVDFRVSSAVAGNEGADFSASLVAGGWCNVTVPSTMAFYTANDASDVQFLSIGTDGSYDPDTYFYVEVEVWKQSRMIGGLGTYVNASLPRMKASPSAPTFNADFLGQEVLVAGTHWYKAVSIGNGAADWKQVT